VCFSDVAAPPAGLLLRRGYSGVRSSAGSSSGGCFSTAAAPSAGLLLGAGCTSGECFTDAVKAATPPGCALRPGCSSGGCFSDATAGRVLLWRMLLRCGCSSAALRNFYGHYKFLIGESEQFIHDRVYGPISGAFLYFPLEIHVVCYQINLMRK